MKAEQPPQHFVETNYEHLDWVAIPAGLAAGEDKQPLNRKQLKNWPLVLAAKQIPWRSQRNVANQWQLEVPAPYYLTACSELRQFEQENCNWPPPVNSVETTENTVVTIWILILLGLFHNLTTGQISLPAFAAIDWFSAGTADAQKILAGQWWRTITALTLHSGGLHLSGNILFGGIIITRLAHLLRSGPAWFFIIISGALGNLLNALVHGRNHQSIGFSTAVFAALALLCVSTMKLQSAPSWRRWPIPLMAGCALLALLGTSGEQTDLGAHLFGFISGIICAVSAFKITLPALVRTRLNTLLSLLTALMLVGAWALALYASR